MSWRLSDELRRRVGGVTSPGVALRGAAIACRDESVSRRCSESPEFTLMRVAIVHDWLTTWAGAERVLERMLTLLPNADLYSTIDVLPDGFRTGLQGRTPQTTALQHLPALQAHYRSLLPLMPFAIRAWDFSAYDLILSSSHAVAKGVRVPRGVRHVCYCHTPMRYAWDLQSSYLQSSGFGSVKAWAARRVLSRLRDWDRRTSDSVNEFVANSSFISERIRRCYGRDSVVIYPPVNLRAFPLGAEPRGGSFVTAGRLVQYKRVDVMLEAFRMRPTEHLTVIGDGPLRAQLEASAPPNVSFVGRLPHDAMLRHLQRAKAFLFAAEEDFGIAPLEAQACGTPVIAYGRGAATETIVGPRSAAPCTGIFFDAQTPHAIVRAIDEYHEHRSSISAAACRTNAARFDTVHFDAALCAILGLPTDPAAALRTSG